MEPYQRHLKPVARTLRNNMTDAERCLWKHLRGKQIHHVQFYRQKPLAGYIADFYCPAVKLVIELDGSQHLEKNQYEYDVERTRVLESLGLSVLRFDNREVLMETWKVLEVIADAVKRIIPPGPPFSKGGA